MEKELRLQMKVADLVLGVATCYDDVTTTDLQGIADVAAQRIIRLVRTA